MNRNTSNSLNQSCDTKNVERFRSNIILISSFLKANEYNKIVSTPSTKNLWAFPLEPVIFFNSLFTSKHLLFSPTSAPILYDLILRIKNKKVSDLFRIFFLNQKVSEKILLRYFNSKDVKEFRESGILTNENRFIIRFIPYQNFLIVTDPNERTNPWLAYIGKDSVILANLIEKYIKNQKFKKGLDLCSGTGIQALKISSFCEQVHATDINGYALELAKLNSEINLINNISFIQSDLFQNLHEEYDLIVANPPYRFLPDSAKALNIDGDGGKLGIEVVTKILNNLNKFLINGGVSLFISLSPVMEGNDLVLDYIKSLMLDVDLNIKIYPISITIDRLFHEFHKKHGIKYFKYSLYIIQKENIKITTIYSLPIYKKILNLVYIFLFNSFFHLLKKDHEAI